MGIIEFSQTRKFKLIMGGMIAFGAFFLVLGMIASLSGGKTVRATGMEITIGTNNGFVNGAYRYEIEVVDEKTNIPIKLSPAKANQAVTFDVNQNSTNFISITPKVKNGQTAVLTLLRNSKGLFEYYKESDSDDKISIWVTCGDIQAIINVKILLPDDKITLSTTLQRYQSIFNTWQNVDVLSLDQYQPSGSGAPVPYRVQLKLLIDGIEIPNINISFEHSELQTVPLGITLWSSDDPYIYLGTGSSLPEPGFYRFIITCACDYPEFEEREFSCFFTLKIVD